MPDIVFQIESPFGVMPSGVAAGPIPPNQVVVTATGSHNFSALELPTNTALKVQVWSAGGGGGGASVGSGGSGGGAGAYWQGTIPQALAALGGVLALGTHGTGGATTVDGTDAADVTITIDSILRLTVGGGKGGAASNGAGGLGGTITADPSVTTTVSRSGGTGVTSATAVGGNGASLLASGAGQGGLGGATSNAAGGAGGALSAGGGGGHGTTGAGGAGAAGKVVFSW
jgi:hypothetical protein